MTVMAVIVSVGCKDETEGELTGFRRGGLLVVDGLTESHKGLSDRHGAD